MSDEKVEMLRRVRKGKNVPLPAPLPIYQSLSKPVDSPAANIEYYEEWKATNVSNCLWIGPEESVFCTKDLKRKRIEWIVRLTIKNDDPNIPDHGINPDSKIGTACDMQNGTKLDDEIVTVNACLADHCDAPMGDIIRKVVPAINLARQRGEEVLIHCQSCISRAPCVAIACLMASEKLTYSDALDKVRVARPTASPNIGFIMELQEWEKACF